MIMKKNDFAVFILTHGRPHNVITLRALQRQNYTGKVYLICDDGDATLREYQRLFGDKVIIFNKDKIAKTFDLADNFSENRSIVYARNASFEIAKKLKIKYFLQLDDDYSDFRYKLTDENSYTSKPILNLDKFFNLILDYYKSIPALTIALGQGGDYFGGVETSTQISGIKRKAMNSFFCSTNRPFKFVGKVNEDVNTYSLLGYKGYLLFTILRVAINQRQTQLSEGGMTGLYLDNGTYQKSFYTVMFCPSFIKIYAMKSVFARLHHKINWAKGVPKIVRESIS